MRLDYSILDVFTDRCFGGNQLAVVWAKDGLDDALMQSIAAEFNLPETVFLSPPTSIQNDVSARIFTPQTELRFAGHPTVGACYAIGNAALAYSKPLETRLRVEEKVGVVTAELFEADGKINGARVASPEPLEIGMEIDIQRVAEAISLSVDKISGENHKPVICTCGNSLLYVELKTRDALEKAQVNTEAFREYLPRELAIGVHLYIRSQRGDVDIEARMFAPMVGIPEDPATGAANLSLAGLLASLDPATDGELTYRIAQGEKMGRPSLLHGSARKQGGSLSEFWIGGSCAEVGHGILTLPD